MRFQHGLQSQALVGDSYFQEKLLLLTFDLLFHLLIEMLDFFIISSNFPAEMVKAESDEVYAKISLSHRRKSWSLGTRNPPGAVGGKSVQPKLQDQLLNLAEHRGQQDPLLLSPVITCR